MRRFLSLYDDSFINFDMIEHARVIKNKDSRSLVVELKNQYSKELKGSFPIEQLEHANDVIIPASHGYYIIWYFKDDDSPPEIIRTPIVAWRIGIYGSASPITFDLDETEGDYTILCPDGQVIRPQDRSWPNITKWEEDMKKEKEPNQ